MVVIAIKEVRFVIALILGVFLTVVISCSYTMPVITNVIKQNGKAFVILLELTSWISAYGIFWSVVAIGIATGLYWTVSAGILIAGKPSTIIGDYQYSLRFFEYWRLKPLFHACSSVCQRFVLFCVFDYSVFWLGYSVLYSSSLVLWLVGNILFKEYNITLQ